MILRDKYKCSCCGGNINQATMTCEYCGTEYKKEHENVVRVETFQNPVRTLGCKRMLDRRVLMSDPEDYSKFAIQSLARQFAEVIAPYMYLESSLDYETGRIILDAKIKVVEPVIKPSGALTALTEYAREGENK